MSIRKVVLYLAILPCVFFTHLINYKNKKETYPSESLPFSIKITSDNLNPPKKPKKHIENLINSVQPQPHIIARKNKHTIRHKPKDEDNEKKHKATEPNDINYDLLATGAYADQVNLRNLDEECATNCAEVLNELIPAEGVFAEQVNEYDLKQRAIHQGLFDPTIDNHIKLNAYNEKSPI